MILTVFCFHFFGVLRRRLYRPIMVLLVSRWFSLVPGEEGTSRSSSPRDRLRWTCHSSSPIKLALRLRASRNSGGMSLCSSSAAWPSMRRRWTKNSSSPMVVGFMLSIVVVFNFMCSMVGRTIHSHCWYQWSCTRFVLSKIRTRNCDHFQLGVNVSFDPVEGSNKSIELMWNMENSKFFQNFSNAYVLVGYIGDRYLNFNLNGSFGCFRGNGVGVKGALYSQH